MRFPRQQEVHTGGQRTQFNHGFEPVRQQHDCLMTSRCCLPSQPLARILTALMAFASGISGEFTGCQTLKTVCSTATVKESLRCVLLYISLLHVGAVLIMSS